MNLNESPYEILTADLQTLERIERTTRDHPSRPLFERLLFAQIQRTKALGRQKIGPAVEPGEEWRQSHTPDILDLVTIPEDAGPPDHEENED